VGGEKTSIQRCGGNDLKEMEEVKLVFVGQMKDSKGTFGKRSEKKYKCQQTVEMTRYGELLGEGKDHQMKGNA